MDAVFYREMRVKTFFVCLMVVLMPMYGMSLSIATTFNPFIINTHGTVTFSADHQWDPGHQVRYECHIFDLNGRLVISFSTPAQAGKPVPVATWDGRNKSGMRVYSGVYIVHVTAENITVNKEDKMKFRLGVLQQ